MTKVGRAEGREGRKEGEGWLTEMGRGEWCYR